MKTTTLKLTYRELQEINFALAKADILDYDTKEVLGILGDKVRTAIRKVKEPKQ